MLALESLFGVLHLLIEAAVEVREDVLPLALAGLYRVERVLHAGGELQIDDVGETLGHELGDDLTQNGRTQVLALLDDVLAVCDRRDRRRVGRRTANALFLHRADECRLRVTGGRLGELLFLVGLFEQNLLALAQIGQRLVALAILLVLGLLIDRGVAREAKLRVVGAEDVARRDGVDRDAVVDGVCHLAGREAAPDEAVEAVLVRREVLADILRRERDVRGTDRLMRVLRAGLGLEGAGLFGVVVGPVAAHDELFRSVQRFLRQAQGVGTHIGDETDGALAGDVDAFIELLGHRHRAFRRHAEAARGLLLQRGGDERGRGRAGLFPALDGLDGKVVFADRVNDRVDLVLAVELHFFLLRAVEAGDDAARLFDAVERHVEIPVFLGLEDLDLVFAVDDHAGRDRLHAPGGKAPADLAPQQRRELVADDAVENAARLLGVDQVLVDLARGGDALRDNLLRDLVEGHAAGFVVRQTEQFF